MAPSPNGSNGRDGRGRFAVGNAGGPGNPFAKSVGELRKALFDAVTAEDLRAVTQMLIRKAKGGDVAAARELLDRTLGKSQMMVALNGTLGMPNVKALPADVIADIVDPKVRDLGKILSCPMPSWLSIKHHFRYVKRKVLKIGKQIRPAYSQDFIEYASNLFYASLCNKELSKKTVMPINRKRSLLHEHSCNEFQSLLHQGTVKTLPATRRHRPRSPGAKCNID